MSPNVAARVNSAAWFRSGGSRRPISMTRSDTWAEGPGLASGGWRRGEGRKRSFSQVGRTWIRTACASMSSCVRANVSDTSPSPASSCRGTLAAGRRSNNPSKSRAAAGRTSNATASSGSTSVAGNESRAAFEGSLFTNGSSNATWTAPCDAKSHSYSLSISEMTTY